MSKHNVIPFSSPETGVEDALTEVLRRGSQELLMQAVQAELEEFLARYATHRDERGRQQVVRNGYLPRREVQTGIGSIPVRVPRVRDRSGSGIRFSSSILPPYLRRSKSLEELIPWLYLKGISTGDFTEALQALLGSSAPGLSPSTVCRLKETWQGEMEAWNRRDLSKKRYVYFWVDGIHCQARLEEASQCFLVILGADAKGNKELVGFLDGYRESEQSWKELLLHLKRQGLTIAPELVVSDGALGFWKALAQVFGEARMQRCWVHKTANVLNNLPKGVQKKAKSRLQDIWMAETREDAEEAFDLFLQAYSAKYPKATECLAKDRDVLLTFYDFPADHWKHLRTTNPVESTFATVRLRTVKTRNCLSRQTALTMVFKLCRCAEKRWRRLNGSEYLGKVIEGVRFQDGVEVKEEAA